MKICYTIKGFKTYQGSNAKAERYIQLGDSGRPVIQTRTGYRADRVILFEDKDQANNFLINFIYDRNRMDIKWEVVEYRASRCCDSIVGMILNTNDYNTKAPGQVCIDWNGRIRTLFYKKRYCKLNGNSYVSFYARTNM